MEIDVDFEGNDHGVPNRYEFDTYRACSDYCAGIGEPYFSFHRPEMGQCGDKVEGGCCYCKNSFAGYKATAGAVSGRTCTTSLMTAQGRPCATRLIAPATSPRHSTSVTP